MGSVSAVRNHNFLTAPRILWLISLKHQDVESRKGRLERRFRSHGVGAFSLEIVIGFFGEIGVHADPSRGARSQRVNFVVRRGGHKSRRLFSARL
jgi:hypothetical protein